MTFGGVPATFTINSDSSLTATAPAEVADTVDIVVTTPTGTSELSSSDEFTYSAGTAPSVSGLSLSGGSTAGGAVVTITGSDFTGVPSVSFGSVAAAFTFLSDGVLFATKHQPRQRAPWT